MTETSVIPRQVATQNNAETLLGNYQKTLNDYQALHTSFDNIKAEKEKRVAQLKKMSGAKRAADLDTYKEVTDRFTKAEVKMNTAHDACRQAGEKVKQLLHDFPDTDFEFNVKRKGVGGLEITDTYSITLTHGELEIRSVQQNAN